MVTTADWSAGAAVAAGASGGTRTSATPFWWEMSDGEGSGGW